jgi:glycosyltransferase involved in cell wall biosynthesis
MATTLRFMLDVFKKKKNNHIVFVLHSSGLSGAERLHIEFVELLVKQGIRVTSIVPKPDGGIGKELKVAGGKVVYVNPLVWWSGNRGTEKPNLRDFESPELERIMRVLSPKLVVTHTGVVPQGAIAAKNLNIKHVWFLHEFLDIDHGLNIPGGKFWFTQFILDNSTRVFANSLAILKHFNLDKNPKSLLVYHFPRFATKSGKMKTECFTLGVVASLQPNKGHETFLRAISILKNNGYKVRGKIIGSGSANDELRISTLITDLNIDDCILRQSFTQDRDRVYDGLDAVVVPSYNESFGRVPFEATAVGIPVLYSNSGGLKEYMIHGKTGLSHQSHNPATLASNVTLLMEDKDFSLRLTESARAELLAWQSRNPMLEVGVSEIMRLLD